MEMVYFVQASKYFTESFYFDIVDKPTLKSRTFRKTRVKPGFSGRFTMENFAFIILSLLSRQTTWNVKETIHTKNCLYYNELNFTMVKKALV